MGHLGQQNILDITKESGIAVIAVTLTGRSD